MIIDPTKHGLNGRDSINNERFAEVISMTIRLLAIHKVLLSKEAMPSNKFAAYWWMRQLLHLEEGHRLTASPCFAGNALIGELRGGICSVLLIVCRFHDAVTVAAKRRGEALEIKSVLRVIINESVSWKNEENAHSADGDGTEDGRRGQRAAYEYQHTEESIDFFLPFAWTLICKHSGIPFSQSAIRIFKKTQ